jgi:hypothetical protein
MQYRRRGQNTERVQKITADPNSTTNVEDKKNTHRSEMGPGSEKIPIAGEADVVPSKKYRAIISGKQLKGKVGTIGGITSGQGQSDYENFYNKGDQLILRSVYKEDISSMFVSSLSFNPVNRGSASPVLESIQSLGGGGGE